MDNLIYIMIFLESNWGVNIRDWILVQASAVALAAVAIILIPMVLKKMWAPMIGTLLASGIALVFVNKPQLLQTIGTAIYNIIFK